MTTTTHDTRTCKLGPDASPCTMCVWAIQQKGQTIERIHALMAGDCNCVKHCERSGRRSADGDPEGYGDPFETDHVHRYQTIEGQSVPECECGAVYDYDKDIRKIETSAFANDWELAPLSMTRTTERECAEYWYRMGRQAREREMLVEQNQTMRQQLRVARERISR